MGFQEGKVVFVRHGGIFLRVPCNILQKVNSYLRDDEEIDAKQSVQNKPIKKKEETEELSLQEGLK